MCWGLEPPKLLKEYPPCSSRAAQNTGKVATSEMLLCPSDQFKDFRQCSEIPNQTAQCAERGQHTPCYGFQFWTHKLIIYRKATIRSVSKLESYLSSSFTSQCSTASPGREDHLPKHSSLVAGFVGFALGAFYFSLRTISASTLISSSAARRFFFSYPQTRQ